MKIFNPSKDKLTVKSILETGEFKNILLVFFHGLGDIVMFQPYFKKLQQEWPELKFKLGLQENMSYEQVFEDVVALPHLKELESPICQQFDAVIVIDFWMSEGTGTHLTKPELCAANELGIEPVKTVAYLEPLPSKICSLHFSSTAIPALSVPEKMASYIWHDVNSRGFIPLECHFTHRYHNSINSKFNFVNSTTRACLPNLSSLISVISNSCAFIGGNSGPFHVACSILPPERILFIDTKYSSHSYNDLPILNIRPNDDYDDVLDKFFDKF